MTVKRVRRDYPVRELQSARAFVARKRHLCGWVHPERCTGIHPRQTYLRISETRLPVCLPCAGVDLSDIESQP